MAYYPKSQPGAVGNDMAAGLGGKVPGMVSANYLGKPSNAIPDYNTHLRAPQESGYRVQPQPGQGMAVDQWTQRQMQHARGTFDYK